MLSSQKRSVVLKVEIVQNTLFSSYPGWRLVFIKCKIFMEVIYHLVISNGNSLTQDFLTNKILQVGVFTAAYEYTTISVVKVGCVDLILCLISADCKQYKKAVLMSKIKSEPKTENSVQSGCIDKIEHKRKIFYGGNTVIYGDKICAAIDQSTE